MFLVVVQCELVVAKMVVGISDVGVCATLDTFIPLLLRDGKIFLVVVQCERVLAEVVVGNPDVGVCPALATFIPQLLCDG